MKNLAVILLLLTGCRNVDQSEKAIAEILAADRAMSKTAATIGFNHALLKYAGDGFVKLNDNRFPVIGKLAFAEKIAGKKDISTLSWEPVAAEAAASGELGYSWGNWKLILPDTTCYGNYFTAWKKTTEGQWTLLLDGGNNTPPPK